LTLVVDDVMLFGVRARQYFQGSSEGAPSNVARHAPPATEKRAGDTVGQLRLEDRDPDMFERAVGRSVEAFFALETDFARGRATCDCCRTPTAADGGPWAQANR
jgi:hypothetical protein